MMLRVGASAVLALLLVACSESPIDSHAWSASSGAATHDAGVLPHPESYAKVVDILQRSCAYVRCHDGPILGGSLRLARDGNFAPVLVGVKACEYDRMARVEPYDPEHSWLMVKLTAAFRGPSDAYANYIEFKPESDWDADLRGCRDRNAEGQPLFGQRMPLTAPNTLPDLELAAIRHWIEEGAPVGP